MQLLIRNATRDCSYAAKEENAIRPDWLKTRAQRLIELIDEYKTYPEMQNVGDNDYNGE